MENLHAELITEISRLAPFETRWRDLAVDRSNAFVTPEWFHAWWEHQGRYQSTPLISIVRDDAGEVTGVMPLVLDRSSRPRAIRFAGASLGDRFHPASSLAAEVGVIKATVAALGDRGYSDRLMLLEHVDSHAPWEYALHRPGDARAVIEQQQTQTSYIPLAGLDWEAYLGQRSKNFRKQVRRAERALLGEHRMTLRHSTEETVDADFIELFRLHDMRLGSLGGSSLNAAARRALHAFALAAAKRGWLRLNVLEAEGRQVAACLGWQVGEVFDSYQGGFDPAWSKLGVGFALEAMTIRGAIEGGATEYDFLLGTENWKTRFTDRSRPSQTTIVVGARNPVRLLVSTESGLRRAAAGITRQPGLGRIVRALHGVFPTVRRV